MKIKIDNPLVEMQGDELAQVISDYVREKIILRFFDIDLINFDLSLENRFLTKDKVTIDAINSLKKNKFGLKVSNIMPTVEQSKCLSLNKIFKTSNSVIRNFIGGSIFREPIISSNLESLIRHWKKPIIVARHALSDQCEAKEEIMIEAECILRLMYGSQDEPEKIQSEEVKKFKPLVASISIHNKDDFIEDFARSCLSEALEQNMNLILTTKNTILKVYDEQFSKIFNKVYEEEFKLQFEFKNLDFKYMLIDEMMTYVLKSEGGFIWACKNYDGDIKSDFVVQNYGSMGLMYSILRNDREGIFMSEATHGAITKYYHSFMKKDRIAASPVATVFMWTRIIKIIALREKNHNAFKFIKKIEKICLDMINNGIITDDLKPIAKYIKNSLSLFEFVDYLSEKIL